MRLALFGATGRAGATILRDSLAAGHDVRAFARAPGPPGRDGPRVTVITGDARDPAAAGQVIDGADAVVSAIGGTRQPGGAGPRAVEHRDHRPGRSLHPDLP